MDITIDKSRHLLAESSMSVSRSWSSGIIAGEGLNNGPWNNTNKTIAACLQHEGPHIIRIFTSPAYHGFKQDKYMTDTKCSTCPATKTTFQGNNTSGNFIPRKL